MRGEIRMIIYQLFYREFLIGVLEVDPETNKHRFTSNMEGVKAAKEMTSLTKEMVEGTDGFVDPIPFFQNRLMNMERNGLDEINYQTDYFLLKRTN